MRRARHLLAIAAVTAALVIVPFAGSAFADPLPPGVYELELDDEGTELTLTVLEGGGALVEAADGVEVRLSYDDRAVLDVFHVRTADGVVEVEIDVDDDGWVATVTPADDDDFPEDAEDDTDADDDHADADDDTEVDDDTDADDDADADDDTDVDDDTTSEDDTSFGVLDEDEGTTATEDADEDEADGTHGEVVSTVAACTPRGRDAREAGLPSHGSIVSQVARGDAVTVEGVVDGFDVTDVAAADELCAALDEAVAAAAAAADAEDADDPSATAEDETDDRPGNGNGRDKDRSDRGNGNGNGNGRSNHARTD